MMHLQKRKEGVGRKEGKREGREGVI